MRRKKEDSAQTRLRILTAARDVFARRGVARTTQEHIAAEAGVSRGAIYWHFANKTELFFAMRDQVSIPLMDRADLALLGPDTADPLASVQRFLVGMVDAVANDAVTRQTLEIMFFKCEYVDDFEVVLKAQRAHYVELCAKLTQVYEQAFSVGLLRANISPRQAALGTAVFLVGLIRMWLVDQDGTLVRESTNELIAEHVAAYRSNALA